MHPDETAQVSGPRHHRRPTCSCVAICCRAPACVFIPLKARDTKGCVQCGRAVPDNLLWAQSLTPHAPAGVPIQRWQSRGGPSLPLGIVSRERADAHGVVTVHCTCFERLLSH